MITLNQNGFLRYPGTYRELDCYKKSVVLYDMTYWYTKRYLQASDRTYGQMQQAARSGKQNIVEGLEDYITSRDTGLHLVNVARGSLQELRADYNDYLNTRHLTVWPPNSERLQRLREFCHSHNDYSDYEPFVNKMSDEEMANMALTLCHQTDKLMCAYIEKLEKQFVTEGGIKERMYAARTGYRQEQDARMKALEAENAALKQRIAELEQMLREPRRS